MEHNHNRDERGLAHRRRASEQRRADGRKRKRGIAKTMTHRDDSAGRRGRCHAADDDDRGAGWLR